MMQYSPFVLPSLSTLRAGCLFLLHHRILSWQLFSLLLHIGKTTMHACAGQMQPGNIRKQHDKSTRNDCNLTGGSPTSFCINTKSFCINHESFCAHAKSFCITHAAFCINPKSFCITPESFCINPKSLCINHEAFCITPKSFCIHVKSFCMTHAAFCSDQKHPKQAPFHVFYSSKQLLYVKISFVLTPA